MAKKRVGSQTTNLTRNHKKLKINLIYLATEGMRHTVGKLSTRTTTSLDRISIRGLLAKLWGSKVAEVPIDAISGVSGKKSHLDVGSMASRRVYYKGGRWWLPPSSDHGEFSVSMWLILTRKVLELCTNHFVWVVCRPVWVNEACQLFLVPSRSSNMPLYPLKCCELGNVPQLLPLPLSSTWTHIGVLWGIGSASDNMSTIALR
jgi:hypothetical protein